MTGKKFPENRSAVFIMPRSSSAWRGAEALWITVAGWASAARRLLGNSWVITADRTAEPEEVIYYPLSSSNPLQNTSKPKAPWLPLFVKTALKDLLLWKNTRAFRNKSLTDIARDTDVQFVWEQHDLFAGPGKMLAKRFNVPFVLYVHAPVVWESSRWNVKRPLWGKFLERFSEGKSLQGADIVAVVSDEVADKVISMGVDRSKIVVSPMSVDPHLFSEKYDVKKIKDELGINDRVVIGWTGSFRSFHGLNLLVDIFHHSLATNPNIVLLLVGDGQERPALEQQVRDLNIEQSVIFAGKKQFAEIPAIVSIFDIAVVSARSAENFHYSPLKLREYLAAGKATLAPLAGEIPQMFQDNHHVIMYRVGDIDESVSKLNSLINNAALRDKLGKQGREHVLSKGTWDYELKKVLDKLNIIEERNLSY